MPAEARPNEALGPNDAPDDVPLVLADGSEDAEPSDDERFEAAPNADKPPSDVPAVAAPPAEAGPFYDDRGARGFAPRRAPIQSPPREVRTRRRIDVPLTVAGGVITSLGAIAFSGGFIGFFASIDCQSGWFFPTCRSTPEWLWVTVAGAAAAGGIGTPLLVSGLRKKRDEPRPAPAVSVSVGPASGSLLVRF